MVEWKDQETIYDKIGCGGLLRTVWQATPLSVRLFLPYGLWVYGHMTKTSKTLADLESYHHDTYQASQCFRLLRPRFREVESFLRKRWQIE